MSEITERLKAALSDRYTIERELGAGGMATVYLAEDLKHHRRVAVKRGRRTPTPVCPTRSHIIPVLPSRARRAPLGRVACGV